MANHAEFACIDCKRSENEIKECRIYQYRFQAFGRRCPRQGPEPPKVIAEVAEEQFVLLPIERIKLKDPIRADILERYVNDMATSFSCHGQIEPIICDFPDEEGNYELVCGRIRYEAMKRFPGRPILARVRKFKDEDEKEDWKMAENLHRRDLTALQKAEHYKKLYERGVEKFGKAYDKHVVTAIAKRQEELAGEKPAERTVWAYLQVERELPKEAKKILQPVAEFGLRHGLELLRLKGVPEKQVELAEEFAEKPMTVQQLKKRVDETLNPPEPKPSPIDTGMLFKCPVCGETYTTIHLEEGKHKLQKIEVMESEG